MAGADVAGSLDPVEVVPAAFDDSGVAAAWAVGVEVASDRDVGDYGGEAGLMVLSGKGRRVAGLVAQDAYGALELDAIWVDVGFGDCPADQGGDGAVCEQPAQR